MEGNPPLATTSMAKAAAAATTGEVWLRPPECEPHPSGRQRLGYLYTRSAGMFEQVVVPASIGPPPPVVEVDLGYKIAVVSKKAYR